MMNYFSGTVKQISERAITLEVGGIGFGLQVPSGSVFLLDKLVHVFVYMHWSSEQGPSLYGFATELEKAVFILIINCSGVGPKIGLAVLSDLGPHNFLQAIQTGDEKMLSRVNGIGEKKAEQIIVQLKHKVGQLIKSGIDLTGAQRVSEWHTVVQALESLNYSRNEINNVMQYLQKNYGQSNCSFDQLLRHALSHLTKQV